ncbi:ribosomal protein S18-alanine N-acetyltransferase [Sansalvadorimonas sp. 2012CJ34-2]|uniref:[Ribosomal protein bS18]-alanine N-acetyltransferase n=1 Tax=Parendozoicomonas callyspongiae TaxID=2942213 RepID=A0ABT0PG39_9GAMM|nr:ribosomal protein S18-alanine N-acetyltransferase [Sansalvadorimonas sp. 2012CJ34-2]MCL6270329.1 ribosomal protein S18-alanine N-acetyltransferase [Sansalvadorimonas sp. 2012CJ34-2]
MTSTIWADGYHVRPMTEFDLPAVHQLETSAHSHPWTFGILTDSLKSGYRCWVLEQDQRIVGYTVVMITVGEGHLLNITISPDFQGQGLGRKLLDFLLEDTREQQAEVIFLEVRVSNIRAIELYEQNGFAEVGRRKGYYPAEVGREDAIVMAQDLKY